jgi:hypothetical protein
VMVTLVGGNRRFGCLSSIAMRRATMDYYERDATFSFCCAAVFRRAVS